MMVCMSNESEINSVYNWKGVCINEGLGELMDTQRLPDLDVPTVKSWITALSGN